MGLFLFSYNARVAKLDYQKIETSRGVIVERGGEAISLTSWTRSNTTLGMWHSWTFKTVDYVMMSSIIICGIYSWARSGTCIYLFTLVRSCYHSPGFVFLVPGFKKTHMSRWLEFILFPHLSLWKVIDCQSAFLQTWSNMCWSAHYLFLAGYDRMVCCTVLVSSKRFSYDQRLQSACLLQVWSMASGDINCKLLVIISNHGCKKKLWGQERQNLILYACISWIEDCDMLLLIKICSKMAFGLKWWKLVFLV